MNRWSKIVLIVVSLIWILVLYAGFYRVQKPFDLEHVLAWLRLFWEVLTAAEIVLLGTALGCFLLRRMGFTWEADPEELGFESVTRYDRQQGLVAGSALEELAFAAPLGLGLLSMVVMAVGMAGGLYRWLFYLLTWGALALLWRDVRGLVGKLHAAAAEISLPRPLALFYLVVLVLTLTMALAPPTSWDALQYHLDGPRLYIRAHRMVVLDSPGLAYSGLLESLFLWSMLLADDVAAQLLHWAYGIGLLVFLYLGARRMLGAKHAWLPVAVIGSMPMVFTLLPWAYNDLALALYLLAAFLSLSRWKTQHQARWLVLSGLFCGFGMGSKYTFVSVPLVLSLLIPLWQPWKRGDWFKSWFILGTSTVMVSAPWFIRNWILWGNPIYPYLFNGLYWHNLRTVWHQRLGTGIGWHVKELFLLPWTASLTLRDVSFREARTGPFFVVMLPVVLTLLVVQRVKKKRGGVSLVGAALGVSAFQYAAWAYGVTQSRSLLQARLLLPTLALFCLPVADALRRLQSLDLPQLSLRRFLLIVLALTLVLNGLDLGLAWAREAPLPYLMGLENRDQNLTRRLGVYYTTMQELNARLTAQDKVLFLWETKGYYCEIPCQPDVIVDRWRNLIALQGNAEKIWRRLLEDGYTHVLLFDSGLEFMIAFSKDPDTVFVQDDELAVLAALQAQYMDEVYTNDHYTLYRLRE